jgi:DNA repair protein RadC
MELGSVAEGMARALQGSRVQRPRERIFDVGASAMGEAELLGLLLGTGSRGLTALQTAELLLTRFDGVGGLARAHAVELRDEPGVGVARAALLAAALELGRRSLGPRADRPRLRQAPEVWALYRPKLGHLHNEVFHVACLDVRNRLLRDARVAEGGFASCALLPREVFAPAMREGAVAVILVHNHPSGDTQPSADDLALTARLARAGEILGIRVVDHVIIGAEGFCSLAALGALQA